MAFEPDLIAALSADTTISSMVGSRIYSDLMPQNPVFQGPTIVFKQIGNTDEVNHDGVIGYSAITMQFDVYAQARADSRTVAAALAGVMLGLGGSTFQGANPRSTRTNFEEETRLYRTSADWEIILST